MYSIIKTIEYLEWAYSTDRIGGSTYDSEFRKLLHSFQMGKESIQGFEGLDSFFKKYDLEHCYTAKKRITEGKSGYGGEESDKNMAFRVMNITETLVGAIDQLEMNMVETDSLLPTFSEI